MSLILLILIQFITAFNYNDLIKTFTNSTIFYDLYFIKTDTDSLCRKQTLTYSQAFHENQQWALQMFDSSSKLQSGVLSGNIANLGDFDQCLSIKKPIAGKYCQIFFHFQNVSKYFLFDFLWSVCIPNQCKDNEIKTHYEIVFSNVDLVLLPHGNCIDRAEHEALYKYNEIDWFIITILITFLTISITATILYTKFKQLNDLSIIYNLKKLLSKSNHDQFNILHGVRVFSMIWIMLYHRYELNFKYYPLINTNDKYEWYKSIKSFATSDPIIVDTFFFIGGFLVSQTFDKMQQKTLKLNIFRRITTYYLHRYIRISTCLIIMMLIQISVVFQISSGPYWFNFVYHERVVCQKNWLYLILFVQNYFHYNYMCLDHTWYLCVDMQLFWLSPLFLYPIYLSDTIYGKMPLITAIITSVIIPLWQTLNNTNTDLELPYIAYFKTHLHATSWLIGLLAHQLVLKTKIKKLSKQKVYSGWIFTLVSSIYVLFGKYYLLNSGRFTIISYVLSSRILWSLITFWIISATIFNHSSKFNQCLSSRYFTLLSQLTYPMYIVHVAVQVVRSSIQRSPEYYNDLNILYIFAGDLLFTFILGTILMLLFEMPILSLSNKLLKY